MIQHRLTYLRALAGISQRHLCRLAGLGETTVAFIESGIKKNPEARTLLRLSEVLGVSTDYLLGNANDRPSASTVRAAIRIAHAKADRGLTLDDLGEWE